MQVAHNNVDKIRLLTADVPGYMKEATEISVTGDEDLVHDYLTVPIMEKRIRQSAEQSVVWKFKYVVNLTSEVLDIVSDSTGFPKGSKRGCQARGPQLSLK